MKKILCFVMMLCGIAAVNAQTSTNDVTFVNNGSTYGNGDTMIVSVERTAIGIEGIGLKNNTGATLEDVRFSMTEVQNNGITAWGLCTGVHCVPDLTSAPFDIDGGATYSELSIDIRIAGDVDNPSSIYEATVADKNGNTIGSVVMRIVIKGSVSIDNVFANAAFNAYPNPAQGLLNVESNIQNAQFVIYDLQGREVLRQPLAGQQTMLSLQGLTPGVYMCGILAEGLRSQMQKLIVK